MEESNQLETLILKDKINQSEALILKLKKQFSQ